MKKVFLFLVMLLSLSSCTNVHMGNYNEKIFKVKSCKIYSNKNLAEYDIVSYDRDGVYGCSFTIVDDIGKYTIGDTILLTKK